MGGEAPLWDPERVPQVDPRDAVRIVHAFLDRCAEWAEVRELPSRLEQMRAEPTADHAAKLHQWATWLAFVRHAQQEIEEGRLDRWFTP